MFKQLRQLLILSLINQLHVYRSLVFITTWEYD